MTATETLRQCLGDPARFGSLRERVEILVDEQVTTWIGGSGSWLVLPVDRTPQGFYLLSEDREGQRCGEEILRAFLGPTAWLTSVAPGPNAQRTDRMLESVRLTHMSHVKRVDSGSADLLARLEDAVATLKGKDARLRPVRPSYVDLLRDLRLALLQRNGRVAERLLEDLRLTGRLSAENLRFLLVELLGRLHRWRELHDLPYLADLLRARRPRVVNEILLEMVWHTEVTELVNAGRSPREIYEALDLSARYGSLIGAVEVPSTSSGRGVGLVAASAQGDLERAQHVVAAATDDIERDLLNRLLTLGKEGDGSLRADERLRELFSEGQYSAFIRAFLERPDPAIVDLAVQATLDSEDFMHATDVLKAVNAFSTEGRVRPDRRLLRDLDDLNRLVSGSCNGWGEWCERLARAERWQDAANVARTRSAQWLDPSSLPADDSKAAADALLDAWGGVNQDQIVASLDVLCRSSAATTGTDGDSFREAILLVLADQTNLSSPVRDAYLLMLERILENGPTESAYRSVLDTTNNLWHRVAAPTSVDWGIGLIDVLLNVPTPDPEARASTFGEILTRTQAFQQRLSIRQQSELAALGQECGIPVSLPAEPDDEESPWHQLDGKVIGLYSLLPGAAQSLTARLAPLCSGLVEGNADTVATRGLRSLAARADFMIVDTWHAAHSATNAIDEVRPRSRQVFPSGRGVSAFMQALERMVTT